MKIETYQCDMCGRKKGESNHWLKVFSNEEIFVISGDLTFNLDHIDDNSGKATDLPGKDICSQECATKCLSEFMAKPIS